jgi:hypothetical protein
MTQTISENTSLSQIKLQVLEKKVVEFSNFPSQPH